MSDLERVLSEAQKAREEAESAGRRATELESQAKAARERDEQEREERRRTWAQQIVDSYDADVSAADVAIQQAQERFSRVAREDLTKAVEAYVDWGEETLKHYGVQLRVSAAAAVLDYEASPPEFVTPPLFSDALDSALAGMLKELGDKASREVQQEFAHLLDGPDLPVKTVVGTL